MTGIARHWLIAAALGLVAGLIAWTWTIGRTPSFLMSRATDRVAVAGAWNALSFAPLANDESRTIVRPSPDLAYASCAYDVSKGPVVIEALPVPAPYWSLSVFNDQTDVAFVRNNRQSGNRPIRVAIVKPGVAAPAGYEPVPVTADKGIALIRVLVADRAQFGPLDQARRLSSCRSVTAG